MGKEKKVNPGKVGLPKLLIWNVRAVSTSILTLTVSLYMLLYCNSVLGLNTGIISIILVVSKVLDGVTDTAAGFIVDKTKTKWGKGRPYEVFVVLAWFCTWLMYSCPTGLSTIVKYIWVAVTYMLINSICVTFYTANGMAYTLRAFREEQVVSLTSYGSVITLLGAALFNIFGPSLFAAAGSSASRWSMYVAALAIPMAVIGILRMFVIKEVYDIDAQSTTKSSDELKIRDILTMFQKDKYLVMICLMSLVFNFVANMGVATYYYTYVVGNLALAGIASACQMIAIPLAFLFPQILKKISIAKLFMIGFIVSAVGYMFNLLAGANVVLLAIAAVFWGAGTVPASMLTVLALMECVDYEEWLGLPRMEGSMSALNGLISKIGAALGTGSLGIILSVTGVSAAVAAGGEMPASAILVLRMLFSVVPGVLYALVALTLSRYDLTKKLPKIREELAERRADATGSAE